MRVSQSVLVAALCSSAFAAPQVPTVVTTVYPTTAATQVPIPKPGPPPLSQVPTGAPNGPGALPTRPIPTLSLSPQQQPEIIPPPRPQTSTNTTPYVGLPKLSPRPRPTPRPAPAPAGPAVLCGTGRPACAAGQYCYDANLDKVVGTTEANSVGTCYGAVCNASTLCPVGQVCGEGYCLNQNLDCGFLGDECPEGQGWRCVGGRGGFARGYCGYSPKFVSI
jgi:hypothetical protein